MLQTGKCYEAVVNAAAEAVNTLLDLEGGRFVVVIVAEMIQELLSEDNVGGAMIILRKLFEVADVTMPEWATLDDSQNSQWLELWADVLVDALECAAA